MPRAFTAVEKETIREKLLQAGRACFLRYGLKKTTIEDLTGPAGIAKASFYLFFESKEALYMEIFMAELPAMMKRLMDNSFGSTDDTREALIRMMKGIVHEMQSNELARIILDDPTQVEKLVSNLDYGNILQQVAGSYAPLVQAIVAAQDRGEIIEGDPFQIAYSLGLVKMLAVNKDRIPEELYNSMIDFAPRVIADGLTCPAQRRAS
ncbi:TetR/AcrR family transcriptional regulator [Candidatus Bipolaricaulota bacterium]